MILAGLFLGIAASGTAVADNHHKGRHHQPPACWEYDTDGEEGLSSKEYYECRAHHMAERAREGGKMKNAGNMPTFEAIDSNGDGVLSREEFAAHQAERQRQNRK
jgi:hypothetical protein